MVHTNLGPTLVDASLWPCLNIPRDGTSVATDNISCLAPEDKQGGVSVGCHFEIDLLSDEEDILRSGGVQGFTESESKDTCQVQIPDSAVDNDEWTVAKKKGAKSRVKEPQFPTRKSIRIQDQGIPMGKKSAMLKSI